MLSTSTVQLYCCDNISSDLHVKSFFFEDAFDYDMTLDTLRKAKAGETVKIPIYDAVNATR